MGSEIKHTPGPWVAKETPLSSNQNWIVLDVNGERSRRVCAVYSNNDEADAKLIAAAPELLQSLKEACDSFAVLAADFDALAATGNDYAKKAAASARNMEAAYRAAITKATA